MLQAKPVVADRFWILKQDDRKIGQINADPDGVTVKIQNHVIRYKTLKLASRAAKIEFQNPEHTKPIPRNLVHGFEVSGRVYNPVWDVKQKLPLFTKESKSKSWFAAGWYRIKQHRTWRVIQNPKLIALQRYSYQGPFHTREQAIKE